MAIKPMTTFQIGKNGLTQNFIESLLATFKRRNLVKISLLRSFSRDRAVVKETAQKLCSELNKSFKEHFSYKIIGFTISIQKWRKKKR